MKGDSITVDTNEVKQYIEAGIPLPRGKYSLADDLLEKYFGTRIEGVIMSEFKIPKRFKLFGKTIEVKRTKDLSARQDVAGVGRLKTHEIEVQTNCDGYTINEEEVTINFLHEVAHFLMYDMEFKLEDGTYCYRHEQFCNLLSLCLHQFLTTMEYETLNEAK